MTNILAFPTPEDRKPHAHGDARCMSCGHSWQAVVPVGVPLFECPQCQAMKGHFLVPFHFGPGTMVRQCHCGCQLFFLSTEGHMCAHCGTYQIY